MERIKNKSHVFHFILLMFFFILNGSVFGKISQKTLAKIDPALKMLMTRAEKGLPLKSNAVEVNSEVTSSRGPEVGVLIKAAEDIRNRVDMVGGEVGSVHGDVVTATIPLSAIPVLAEDDHIVYIEASRFLYPDLNYSVPLTGADILQNLPVPHNITGRGVIVGFTDTGIDINHDDFKDADGNTRILYIWDQYGGGSPPAGFRYGAEYTADDINSGTCPHQDEDGHGSHVAGIAAGDGSSTGPYIGMAPEANIIFVRNDGRDLFNRGATTRGTLDGYDYIRDKANELGMPHVINTSQSSNMGPHDGKTLFEQAVNNDVAEGSIIVVSAGNRADDALHAEAIVTPENSVTLTFNINNTVEDGEIELDIWFKTNDQLEVEVAGPNAGFQEKVSILENRTFNIADGRIQVQSDMYSPLNFDNRIMIVIDDDGSAATQIAQGNWQVRLSAFPGNTLPDGGEIDAWFERNDPVRFSNFVDAEETLAMPACADSAITVASYDKATGNISSFSSRGPRRDGVLKPDIASIGGNVISVLSADSDDDIAGDNYHTQKSGTSMSSPHVAGAIALMLQVIPDLTPSEAKRIILNAGRMDNITGEIPNITWGFGKMEILKPLIPYASTAMVAGVLKDEDTGDPITAEIQFTLPDVQFPIESQTVLTDSLTGEFSINLMPTGYEVTIIPQIPYPQVDISPFEVSADTTTLLNLDLQPADILLVNDDPDGRYSEYFASAVDSLNMTYANWTIVEKSDVTSDALDFFNSKIVIWFTGDAVTDVLTTAEQEVINNFLDKGGRLFLTGQNIAEDLKDNTFLSERLHVSFLENTINPMLDGAAGNAIGDGLRLITTGQFGANNQTSRDIIVPDSLAVPCFFYNTVAGTVGGIHFIDPENMSRLVYFSFGFEAINTRQGLPFNTREEVLETIVDWLLGLSGVADNRTHNSTAPMTFELGQNYPNPFSATGTDATTIFYHVPKETEIEIHVYNLLGQRIKTLISGKLNSGMHTIQWDGQTDSGNLVPSGIYFYSMQTPHYSKTKKIVVMR